MEDANYDRLVIGLSSSLLEIERELKAAYIRNGNPGVVFYEGVISAVDRAIERKAPVKYTQPDEVKNICERLKVPAKADDEARSKEQEKQTRSEETQAYQHKNAQNTLRDFPWSIFRSYSSLGLSIVAITVSITFGVKQCNNNKSAYTKEQVLKSIDSMLLRDTAVIRQTNRALLDLQKNVSALRDSVALLKKIRVNNNVQTQIVK